MPTLLLLTVLTLLSPGLLLAQQESRCASCHFANPNSPGEYHLSLWERSAHARNGVGCEECHGGNADTFELFQAHQDILNARNPSSPVHRNNIVRTCGTCHTGQFVEFQRSRHYELVQEGDPAAPVCTICHDEVAAELLSPTSLEARCADCHAEDKISPNPEFPAQGREMMAKIAEVRALLNQAKPLLKRIKDRARKEILEEAYGQAEVPLREAVVGAHSFVYDGVQERLAVARKRTEALLETLANP